MDDTSAGHGHPLVALQNRAGGGLDVRDHHAKTGGGGSSVCRVCLDHRGQLCSCASWQQVLVGSSLMQYGRQDVNPCVRMRLAHPNELTWYSLHGVLFHIGQHEAEFVCHRGQRTGAIGTIAPTRARVPVNRTVLHRGHKGLFNMGEQGLKFAFHEPSHRASTPSTLGPLCITWHRHLPLSVSWLGEMVHYKP